MTFRHVGTGGRGGHRGICPGGRVCSAEPQPLACVCPSRSTGDPVSRCMECETARGTPRSWEHSFFHAAALRKLRGGNLREGGNPGRRPGRMGGGRERGGEEREKREGKRSRGGRKRGRMKDFYLFFLHLPQLACAFPLPSSPTL